MVNDMFHSRQSNAEERKTEERKDRKSIIISLIWIIGLITLMILSIIMIDSAHANWSGCDLVLSNPTDQTVVYNVEWLDHDIERYQGRWIIRCGGELKSGATYRLSDFLGIGRHRISWNGEQTIMQEFTVDTDSTVIELSIKHW